MKQQKFMKEKTKFWGVAPLTMHSLATMRNIIFGAIVVAGMSACGLDVSNGVTPTISGPPVSSDGDVKFFADTLYSVFTAHNCSNCHNSTDQPNASFADSNPNVAYYVALNRLGETDFNGLPVLKAIDINATFTGSVFQDKVSTGHNCGSTAECAALATEMGTQIVAWATLVQSGGIVGDQTFNQPTNEGVLSAPPDGQPRDTIVVDLAGDYSAHLALFNTQLYTPILTQYCSNCHSSSSSNKVTPYFADSNMDVAFRAIIESRKVDLNTPMNSRVFLRLAQDQHNCWSTCGNATSGDAGEMLAGINAWSTGVTSQAFNADNFTNSRALFLNDGQVASGGVRYDRFAIAKYAFNEGSGATVHDQSGVFPAIDLTLEGDYEWLSSYGVIFHNGSNARSRSTSASQKLYDKIQPRGEFTVEAWVVPANLAQDGPAAMVSYSSSPTARNFTAAQSTTYYDFALRKDANAEGDNLSTDDVDVVLTSQQHVVMTYSTTEGRRIYVDGVAKLCETEVTSTIPNYACEEVRAPKADPTDMGSLLNWSTGQLLTLASEPNGQRQWQGMIRMVAIHNRALTPEQITQNFEAGVGQKFNLLFSIGTRTDANGNPVIFDEQDNPVTGVPGVPDNSYIWFEVSQFDNFSYSFSTPYFIILDNTLTADVLATRLDGMSVPVKGMRIGLNGKEPEVGQAYTRMGYDGYKVNDTNYERDPSDNSAPSSTPPKWLLSKIGTIIAKENGVNDDQFFLTFEVLGSDNTHIRVPGTAGPLPFQYDAPSTQFTLRNTVVGLRTFNEISASMEALTKTKLTSFSNADQTAINDLLTQLPAKTIMEGFVSSQQMAIANMAGIYCKNLVEGTGLQSGVTPASFFGVNSNVFTSNVTDAFTPSNQSTIIAALAKNIGGQDGVTDIANQPSVATITTELGSLANDLKTSCNASLDIGGGNLQDCTGSARTKAIIKAMCMATLGSAAVSHQ